MSDVTLQSLTDISKVRLFNKGEIVFQQGEQCSAIYKVLKGEVHLHRHDQDGKRVLLYRAYENNFFAEASLNSDQYHCTASCASDSSVLQIDSKKMMQILANDAQFSAQWIAVLSSELRRQRASVTRLNMNSASERLKHYLLTEGQPSGQIDLKGTLSDLAEVLGLSRESLYRTLRQLEQQQVIERKENSIKLIT
ncbi:MAG: Crp/Fnr family transcriptional regulator [Gammaproteobacteria bacterium]|nr:Crp/Fnr family transcriptional regulator [Gammaproteobacteria bacterium]